MKCMSCGGQLAFRETFSYPIDENGVYESPRTAQGSYNKAGVYCLNCEARHAYDIIHESGDKVTIALEVNSDPEPVAMVAIGFRGGAIDAIGAGKLVGLVAIDEDRQEIGRFMACPGDNDAWWERVMKLEALIKKGESRASFAGEENDASDKHSD